MALLSLFGKPALAVWLLLCDTKLHGLHGRAKFVAIMSVILRGMAIALLVR